MSLSITGPTRSGAPTQSWRTQRAAPYSLRHRGRQQGSSYSGLSSAAGSTQNISGLRASDRIHSPATYTPGCIFSAPFHTQDVEINLRDENRTESVHGPIHSKYRKLVVVKRYYKHCIVIPMFSYNNSGLRNKPGYHDEFITIRDPNQADAHAMPPATRYGVLWTDGTNRKGPDDSRFFATSPASVLHLTHLVSHDYMMKSTLHGRLDAESTEHLVALFDEVTRHGRRWRVMGQVGETMRGRGAAGVGSERGSVSGRGLGRRETEAGLGRGPAL